MPERLNSTKQIAIQGWIETTLGISAIWTDQNSLRPALPYISINIIAGPQLDGTPQRTYKTTNIFTYLYRKVFTLSIQSFSNTNHLALLSDLINSITLPSKAGILKAAGLAVYNNTSISPTNISELINTGIEKRGSIDVTMAYAEEVDDPTGEIIKTNVSGISGTKFENVNTDIEI